MPRKRSEVRPVDPRVRLVSGAWALSTVTLPAAAGAPVPHVDIVKLVPSRGMTAAQRQEAAQFYRSMGARHVWFAPARGGERSLPDQAASASPVTAETAREAVAALLDESYSMNPARLCAVIEEALARAGL